MPAAVRGRPRPTAVSPEMPTRDRKLDLGPPEKGSGTSLTSEEAFRTLFVEHYGELWAYLGSLGIRSGEREDLIHEAFLRIYERRDRLAISDARTYLYSVLRNAVYGGRRRAATERRGGRAQLESGADLDQQLTSQPNPEEAGIAKERRERLVQAMGMLPPKMRRCAVLRHEDGLSTTEIAQKLGIAEGTVRAHLHHAAKRLREILQPGAKP